MSPKDKNISNPYSTGGGGVIFENRVQAAFVTLLLTYGMAPCLQPWPIQKIKFQTRSSGFHTDDLLVVVKELNGDREAKLLCQIKHSISITKSNVVLAEVIQAAWKDFQNPEVFSYGMDAIALITGPLTATDIYDTRMILEWARQIQNPVEFVARVEQSYLSSATKREKLKVLRAHLNTANNNEELSDELLWKFLRSFHLLGYDLDIQSGVTHSLLFSSIGQYSPDRVQLLWTRVVDFVQTVNPAAGDLTRETLPQDLSDAFKERVVKVIPDDFVSQAALLPSTYISPMAYSEELIAAELLGGWNEAVDADKLEIEKFTHSSYPEWIQKVREIHLQHPEILSHRNNKWAIQNRAESWDKFGSMLFDDQLDLFKDMALSVLGERDPQLDLPEDKRFTASIYGKVLQYSPELRKGLADSLALLGSRNQVLTSVSIRKAEIIARLTVRELFADADWRLWCSLTDLLPLLAEAAPDEFLNALEKALSQTPCPFDILFEQEGDGITGRNYLTGVLWALEMLAWEEQNLIRVTAILGELANHDPGGRWANRPANSLITIFLPWHPQTKAPIEKRRTAIETLQRELPSVAWNLLLSLLPNATQSTSGSYKPTWRKLNLSDIPEKMTHQEYWDQVSGYAQMAVNVAQDDFSKMVALMDHFIHLPPSARDELIAYFSEENILKMPEEYCVQIWDKLTNLVTTHKRAEGAKWAMPIEQLQVIEEIASRLEPKKPSLRYRQLFSNHDHQILGEKGSWEEQNKELERRRLAGIAEIFQNDGIEGVVKFANIVESPWKAGISFGTIAPDQVDPVFLPTYLDMNEQKWPSFISGYIRGKHMIRGWDWVDHMEMATWSPQSKGQFFAYLPFIPETWNRAQLLLGGDEAVYWLKAYEDPYQPETNLELAISKLIQFGRPKAAIRCLHKLIYDRKPIDQVLAIDALLAAISSSESSNSLDRYEVVRVIKHLQDDPNVNLSDLLRLEWAYLPLLTFEENSSPRFLSQSLADNPDFFCEVLRMVFRSKKSNQTARELNEQEKNQALNAYRLLDEWRIPPGVEKDGSFNGVKLSNWLGMVKKKCEETGHLDMALLQVGKVLLYGPPAPDGFWIHPAIADVLNAKDANKEREGYSIEIYNSRGVHSVDPSGKAELELAEKYLKQADEVENRGYYRFAITLRELAHSYQREAERVRSWDD